MPVTYSGAGGGGFGGDRPVDEAGLCEGRAAAATTGGCYTCEPGDRCSDCFEPEVPEGSRAGDNIWHFLLIRGDVDQQALGLPAVTGALHAAAAPKRAVPLVAAAHRAMVLLYR